MASASDCDSLFGFLNLVIRGILRREQSLAGVVIFSVVRSVCLCAEWTSPGAGGAKVSSCEFDRLLAVFSSLVIL